jgi:hypothetical protein
MNSWINRFLAHVSLFGLFVGLLAGCGEDRKPPVAQDFLSRHWVEPLPPQGPPPQSFSALEASLSPKACGQCHIEQYQAWRTSLHSQAVGPGLLWQLKLMDQAQANRCLRCHAPLAEQKALLALEHGWQGAPSQPAPNYVEAELGRQGLVCAACHVRNHQRFGPPSRGPLIVNGPHGGFTQSDAFGDSKFCAHCHQFADDGPRINGKLQEDTYQQWLASPQAADQNCQSCHMPDRKHLWRGIHDPEMTLRAIDVSLNVTDLGLGQYAAHALVRNVGAGHHFPTYMVPKVDLVFLLHQLDGRSLEVGRHVIGWTVDTDITREIADTRIPAGSSRMFDQPFAVPHGLNWRLELIVRVRPGEHYERIYRASLGQAERLPPNVLPDLKLALSEVRAAEYELLRREFNSNNLSKR